MKKETVITIMNILTFLFLCGSLYFNCVSLYYNRRTLQDLQERRDLWEQSR